MQLVTPEPAQTQGLTYDGYFSSVLVIEMEFDLDEYHKQKTLRDRHSVTVGILELAIKLIPPDAQVDIDKLREKIAELEQHNFEYQQEIGRWISNPSKTLSVRLWAVYS